MNILILAKHRSRGGLIKHIGLLTRGLSEYEGDNVVIGICPGEGAEELRKECTVEIIPFSVANLCACYRSYTDLCRIIKRYSIDIIQSENRVPSLFASAYCFLHRKVKYLWSNHQVPIPAGFFHRLLTKYGGMAVAEGIEGRSLLINELHIPEDKTRIINLGIDLQSFIKIDEKRQEELKDSLGIRPGVKTLMLYGRLAESKGHLFLLEALNNIHFKDFCLILPGDNDAFKAIVLSKARQYGLVDKLVFPGFVNGRDYLSISDLMLLPSKNEGFPQACVEAYAMGVPVIRTKTGGFEDTLDMCWGVDYGDVSSLSGLLSAFFEDDTRFIEKANYAVEAVKRLSVKAMAHNYQMLYQEILSK